MQSSKKHTTQVQDDDDDSVVWPDDWPIQQEDPTNGLLEQPTLPLGAAVRACSGCDVYLSKKATSTSSRQHQQRYLALMPGVLSLHNLQHPISASSANIELGQLSIRDDQQIQLSLPLHPNLNPSSTAAAQVQLVGQHIRTKSKFLLLTFQPKKNKVICRHIFDSVLVFGDGKCSDSTHSNIGLEVPFYHYGASGRTVDGGGGGGADASCSINKEIRAATPSQKPPHHPKTTVQVRARLSDLRRENGNTAKKPEVNSDSGGGSSSDDDDDEFRMNISTEALGRRRSSRRLGRTDLSSEDSERQQDDPPAVKPSAVEPSREEPNQSKSMPTITRGKKRLSADSLKKPKSKWPNAGRFSSDDHDGDADPDVQLHDSNTLLETRRTSSRLKRTTAHYQDTDELAKSSTSDDALLDVGEAEHKKRRKPTSQLNDESVDSLHQEGSGPLTDTLRPELHPTADHDTGLRTESDSKSAEQPRFFRDVKYIATASAAEEEWTCSHQCHDNVDQTESSNGTMASSKPAPVDSLHGMVSDHVADASSKKPSHVQLRDSDAEGKLWQRHPTTEATALQSQCNSGVSNTENDDCSLTKSSENKALASTMESNQTEAPVLSKRGNHGTNNDPVILKAGVAAKSETTNNEEPFRGSMNPRRRRGTPQKSPAHSLVAHLADDNEFHFL